MTPTELRDRAEAGLAAMMVVPAALAAANDLPRGWTHILVALHCYGSGEWEARLYSRACQETYSVGVRSCSCYWWVMRCQCAELEPGDDGAGLCKHSLWLSQLLGTPSEALPDCVDRMLPPVRGAEGAEERRQAAAADVALCFA